MDQQQEPLTPSPGGIIVDHHRELSSGKKRLLISGGIAMVAVVLLTGFAMLSISNIDAASCVKNSYKQGAQDKCIGYIQTMVNGIKDHFAGTENNSVTISKKSIGITNKLDATTSAAVNELRTYTGVKGTDGAFSLNDWATVCNLTRKVYRAYTKDLRSSEQQNARTAYTKSGCSVGMSVASDADADADAPVAPTDTASDDSDVVTSESEVVDDQASTTAPLTPTPPTSASASTSMSNMTLASWNLAGGESVFSASKDRAGLSALQSSVDVIGLQQSHLASFRKTIRDSFACESCTYAMVDTSKLLPHDGYKIDESLPLSIPILWNRSRFQLKDQGVYTALAKGYIDADGRKVTKKWIAWVELKDSRTGKSFIFINTHTVATVEAMGVPRYPLGSSYKQLSKSQKAGYQRAATFKKHMDQLTTLVTYLQERNEPIFITGDFNVNYRYDATTQYKDFPYARLGALNVKSSWELLGLQGVDSARGSQGENNRIIDYVFSWDKANVDYVSASINPERYGSDHYPVLTTVNLK